MPYIQQGQTTALHASQGAYGTFGSAFLASELCSAFISMHVGVHDSETCE